MTSTAEGAGVELAYEIDGSGAPLLLIHDIASDRLGVPVIRSHPPTRCIRYDRRGYGDSGAPEPYAGTTVMEQAEDAAALLRGLGMSGAVVAGIGFGALIALDLALRHGGLVRAVAAADPPLFAFVPEANEELAEQRRVLQDSMATGGPDAAVEAWLAGRDDPAALERAKASHRGFFADYAGLASWPVTRAQLRSLTIPVTVVIGPQTPWHVARAAEAIAALVPDAQRREDGDLVAAAAALVAETEGTDP
jgi:pimeloyl-ACP methyl ester carboxylesterase